ncbi:MAG: aminomethyl-transferring glycine dehydrogenase subunit GcvPB [Actinobacteria bacterium]|nr:aminomethyl-transferring glycine dehydrogenase subunit GcvPB [Actinomycetota bacterium]
MMDQGSERAPGESLQGTGESLQGTRESLIFEKSHPGLRGYDLPAQEPVGDRSGTQGKDLSRSGTEGRDLFLARASRLLPGVPLRADPPALPELSEPQVVRHYTRLSQLNQCIDCCTYPLGSCTMKYNPKLNDEVASLDAFVGLHPFQDESETQGMLELLWELERALLALTGLKRISLQPAAGAQGELAGMLMIRAYQRDRGQGARDEVLTPDSAHGTNLASAAMAGYQVKELRSSDRGLIDISALEAALSERTAALMLTNPNTLGLFEEDIVEITALVHQAGGLVYYDGANLNAIMGKVRPGDMGVDVMHMNLHKTFSAPHGGGGPGAGPIAAGADLEPYLPVPIIVRRSESEDRPFGLNYDRPQSIGRLRGFYGNVGAAIRAYAYILRMGAEGLTQASEDAVLNANYMRARLRDLYDIPYDRTSMHEFVISASRQKARGVSALDIAKRVLDFGVHAPTVYFPLIVPEALMIEPTETEDLASLDAYIEILREVDRETREAPDVVLGAPCSTPVRRPDEARAAREPALRWRPAQ